MGHDLHNQSAADDNGLCKGIMQINEDEDYTSGLPNFLDTLRRVW